MDGQLLNAWRANAGGLCLALAACVGGCWAVFASARGVATPQLPRRVVAVLVYGVSTVTLVDWLWKLYVEWHR